jgi:hypothetical protein
MSIEPIGLITFIVGLICLQLGYQATVATLVVSTLLGSAAAILVGTANIPPAHLLLAFVAISTLTRRLETARMIRAISFPEPGFWLLCLVVYGILTGFAMPRLLSGTMPIIPLGTSVDYAETGSTVPLGPVTGNLTQGIYLVGDLACFVMIVAIASTQSGFATVAGALLAYAVGNVIFAVIDLVTFATGTQWLLDFIRNAQYALHIEEEIAGLKRIVGSFTEASAFAGSTLGALGFTGTLWLCGYRPVLTGALAVTSLALVVLSTSSTGLAGTPPVLVILYITALMRRGIDFRRPVTSALLVCAPLLIVAVILAAQLDQETFKPIRDYLDVLIFSKSTSDSGIERASWNSYAMGAFFGSYGLGVGLGTVRTSSFPVALLSNVGVPGTIFYLFFVVSAFVRRRGIPRTFPSDVRLAARNACLGLIIGATFAGTTLEQGLMFYVLAAMACAEPEREIATFSRVTNRPVGAQT